MDMTPRLQLPYIASQQAQKQVTYNEAMRRLDTLVHPVVKSRTLATPPGSPAEGDAYLVAASPTGDWAGKDGRIAVFVDGAWMFHAPLDGWLLFVEADEQFVQRKAGTWVPLLAAVSDLSDYEEGTWSPGLTFGGGNTGMTLAAATAGHYTRIGRLCVARFLLHLSVRGSSTGAAAITGLPFAAVASPVLGALTTGWAASIGSLSGPILGTVTSGGTTVSLYVMSGGSATALTHGSFGTNSQIHGVVTYDAA